MILIIILHYIKHTHIFIEGNVQTTEISRRIYFYLDIPTVKIRHWFPTEDL